jgi:hypothetical protein
MLLVGLLISLAVDLIHRGKVSAGLVPILLSPTAMAVIRLTMENGKPKGMFDPATQSWAFLFGDTIALPLAFIFSALSWRRLAKTRVQAFYLESWWLIISLTAAIVITGVWRFSEEYGYTAAGYESLLTSPSKWWHDIVVFGSLSFIVVMMGVPAILRDFRKSGKWVLVALALWAGLGIYDGQRGLDPANLHPPVQNTILRT